jgi:hypothetical protein
MVRQKALERQDDQHNTDDLRFTLNVPKWVQDWNRPFYIEVTARIVPIHDAIDRNN